MTQKKKLKEKIAQLKTLSETFVHEAQALLAEIQGLRLELLDPMTENQVLSLLSDMELEDRDSASKKTPVSFKNLERKLRLYFFFSQDAIHAMFFYKIKELIVDSARKACDRKHDAAAQKILAGKKTRGRRPEETSFLLMTIPLLREHGAEQMLAALKEVHATGNVLERAKKLLGID